MALLKIRKFPDDSLKTPAAPVKNINGNVEGLIDSMVQTMYAAPGVGLAAPQVGESKRIIVLDTDHEQPGKHLLKLINPQVVPAMPASKASNTRPAAVTSALCRRTNLPIR